MDAGQIHSHIEELVAQEHELWDREARGEATDADREQLAAVKVKLDQYWDLLRQRRALEEFKLDPDAAKERDPGTVENYRQ
jgi:Protein of unknown function (DUF2630)